MILTGGLDLSVPWTITFSGILLAGIVQGSDAALVYALPLVLAIACLIGLVNGLGIVVLGLSPIVVTLAMNGFLQGAALIYSNGTPAGFSSPLLRCVHDGACRWAQGRSCSSSSPSSSSPSIFLSRTTFGRRVYGIGNGVRVARAFRHRRRAHADRRLRRSPPSAPRSSASC